MFHYITFEGINILRIVDLEPIRSNKALVFRIGSPATMRYSFERGSLGAILRISTLDDGQESTGRSLLVGRGRQQPRGHAGSKRIALSCKIHHANVSPTPCKIHRLFWETQDLQPGQIWISVFHDRVGETICEYMRGNLFSNMAVAIIHECYVTLRWRPT
jgi:hypothetical protein